MGALSCLDQTCADRALPGSSACGASSSVSPSLEDGDERIRYLCPPSAAIRKIKVVAAAPSLWNPRLRISRRGPSLPRKIQFLRDGHLAGGPASPPSGSCLSLGLFRLDAKLLTHRCSASSKMKMLRVRVGWTREQVYRRRDHLWVDCWPSALLRLYTCFGQRASTHCVWELSRMHLLQSHIGLCPDRVSGPRNRYVQRVRRDTSCVESRAGDTCVARRTRQHEGKIQAMM